MPVTRDRSASAEKPEQRTVQPDWRAGNSPPPAPPVSQTSPTSTFNLKQAKELWLPGKEANHHESPKTSQAEAVRGRARLVSWPGGRQSPADHEPSAKGPRGGRWVYPHLCRAPSQVSWAAGDREADGMFCGTQVWVAGPATCLLSNLSLVIQTLPASSMSKGSHSLLEGLLEGLKTACACVKVEWQRPSVPAGSFSLPCLGNSHLSLAILSTDFSFSLWLWRCSDLTSFQGAREMSEQWALELVELNSWSPVPSEALSTC